MGVPQLHPGDPPRLRGQVLRLQRFYLAHAGRFFTLRELVQGVGATSEAGISARLRQMTGDEFRWTKEKRKRGKNLWEYKMVPPGANPQLELLP